MYSRAGLTRCTQQINLVLAAATKLPNNDINIYNENIRNIDTIRNSIIKQANFPDNNESNNHNNNNGNNISTNTTNNNNINNKKSPITNWVIKPKIKRNSKNSHTSYSNNHNNDQHNKYSHSSSSYRRSHNKIAKSCLRSSDCDTSIGESCYFLYEGCSAGHCMCQNDYRHNGIIDRCRKKFINESCTRNGDCHAEMICAPATIINNINSNLDSNFDNNKVCQCPEKTIASDDGSFCLVGQLHRLLGTKCQPSTHECLQKAAYGYTRTDTECHSEQNICTCVEGFRKERMACLKSWF
ncbi:hypothetical protein HELRODRAFT_166688 [Helobdella robusta]|uniref:EB domain-containing protein n=1 Tax=Helobdella robusta TaxID=6412 RepID=T1EYD2_HELRO|nr:hypothetical protein HELRODRAFT_166688 [Helobdella robusta]ESO11672.1 hypothetical protein HELRODRAFT_166688 [Helobdella robusta]